MALQQLAFGEDRNHRGVVSAEFWLGEEQFQSSFGAGFFQFGSQGAVAGDAAGGGDAVNVEALGGADGFLNEDIDNGGLDAGAQITDGLLGREGFRMVAQEVADGGFQSAETEIIVGVFDHRPWEIVCACISAFGEAVHLRSARVGEAQQFGGLVEAFAGGIVDSRAEHHVVQFGTNVDQHGVAAADDE